MTIHYLTGDVTRPIQQKALIAHVVNDIGAFGAGVSGAIGRRWPEVERSYRELKTWRGYSLGHVQFVQTSTVWALVANMIAQSGIRRVGNMKPIRYAALEQCLKTVAQRANIGQWPICMPRIGCGLAGGTWSEVEPIIQRTCDGLDVFVYDLETV